MKCSYCGAELKTGCLYCSYCGHESQVISDDTLLEEELLKQILLEDDAQGSDPSGRTAAAPAPAPGADQKKPSNASKKNRIILITVAGIVGVLLIALILLLVFRNSRQDDSVSYQISQAESCVEEKNYAKAVTYYKKAIELDPDDLDAKVALAKVYRLMEDEISVTNLVNEILKEDPDNVEAYRLLINGYAQKNDYEAIEALKEGVTDSDVLALFEDYAVAAPSLSEDPGTYSDVITIELSASSKNRIYYTIDGSDPQTEGELYNKKDPIEFTEQGTYQLRAVSCNEYGIYSEEVGGTYEIVFEKPDTVRATPDSGTFFVETQIVLNGSSGCTIYYTLDGTDPTTSSTLYTGPITIPEGNHILSAIQVDEHGMASDVLRCNYIYQP